MRLKLFQVLSLAFCLIVSQAKAGDHARPRKTITQLRQELELATVRPEFVDEDGIKYSFYSENGQTGIFVDDHGAKGYMPLLVDGPAPDMVSGLAVYDRSKTDPDVSISVQAPWSVIRGYTDFHPVNRITFSVTKKGVHTLKVATRVSGEMGEPRVYSQEESDQIREILISGAVSQYEQDMGSRRLHFYFDQGGLFVDSGSTFQYLPLTQSWADSLGVFHGHYGRGAIEVSVRAQEHSGYTGPAGTFIDASSVYLGWPSVNFRKYPIVYTCEEILGGW